MDERISYGKNEKKLPITYVAVINGCYDSPKSNKKQITFEVEEPHAAMSEKSIQMNKKSSQLVNLGVQGSKDSSNSNFNNAIFSSCENLVDYEEKQVFMNLQPQTPQVC